MAGLSYIFIIMPVVSVYAYLGEIQDIMKSILSLSLQRWQDRVTHWQRARFRREMDHITRHKNYIDACTIVNAFRVLENEEVDAHVSYGFNNQQHTATFNNPEDAARLLHTLVAEAISAAKRQRSAQAGVIDGVVLEHNVPGGKGRDSLSDEATRPIASPVPAR